jgi:ABC-2 type transport system ATP-binding protein
MHNDNVIEVENLTKRFGKFTAVEGVTFSIRRGEIFGFLGPNGAGKSTTIRMLCGLLGATAGTATVGGCEINRDPEGVRQHIGYMSQKFSLYRDLTVAENLTFFGGMYGLDGARLRDRAAAVVAQTGLDGVERQLAGTLSGALQQRLALGCALLHEPPILFLDEPTSGVDPIARRMFWALIHELAGRGVTVLVTTHFMDEAEFCGRIGFISAGKLIALDAPAALKRGAVTEDLFEVEPERLHGAAEKVAVLEGVVACAYFGTRLHVFCHPQTFTPETLRAASAARGVAVRRVARVAPTLEDAFVRLAQQKDQPQRSRSER